MSARAVLSASAARRSHPLRSGGLAVCALVLVAASAAPVWPAVTARAGETTTRVAADDRCRIPSKVIKGTPWSLKRVMLDRLWQDTKGEGVTVAVVDTGVDNDNPQLTDAVNADLGRDFISRRGDGTADPVGHGTKVAGIIAARPAPGTGFVGIAPAAVVLPIRQNDGRNRGKADTMARAIRYAVGKGAEVINISQDTTKPLGPESKLAQAVQYAVDKDVVIVASAGNNGADGKARNTYPAALPDVLAVGATDRNNERAPFSQPGEFVSVAAPGVDMVSTVPGAGQCEDDGTSFSAPYVAGVAALLRSKHPEWTNRNVVAQIQQTAQRSGVGHNRFVGWGVVDPVKALTDDSRAITEPTPDAGVSKGDRKIVPVRLTIGETPRERKERLAMYFLGGGAVTVVLLAGGAVTMRDWRRRNAGGRAS